MRSKKAQAKPSSRRKNGQVQFVIFFTSKCERRLLSPNFNIATAKMWYQVGLVTANSFAILEKRA
jgi:hypothetical protein